MQTYHEAPGPHQKSQKVLQIYIQENKSVPTVGLLEVFWGATPNNLSIRTSFNTSIWLHTIFDTLYKIEQQ